jgi:effector-binding domain-containing protein
MTPQDPEATVNLEHRDPLPILSIRENAAIDALANAQGERLRELWQYCQSRRVAPAGPPVVRYHTFGEGETDVEVGVPVREGAAGEGRIRAGELPGGPVITTWHLGAHDRLGEAYGRLAAWLTEHDRDAAGPAWEVYWWIDASREPDPSAWPAPTEWRTELVQPLADNP